jgi:hypothetical protein
MENGIFAVNKALIENENKELYYSSDCNISIIRLQPFKI